MIDSICPGAGKTLTSFKAAQLVSELDDVDKVMFVVDRHDLDTQTQSMKRSLVITLYLVVCLFKFHATTFQFNLHKWQTID